MQDLKLTPKQYVLATIHLVSNTDDQKNLTAIVDGLIALNKLIKVIFPLHPRTKFSLEKFGLFETINSQLLIIPPVT